MESAFTSPVKTECGMFVMSCMQCCIHVFAVCSVVCSVRMCCFEEVYRCLLL